MYKNKLDELGTIVRIMDRIVVQGYNQEDDIDYDDTFDPVSRMEAIIILIVF